MTAQPKRVAKAKARQRAWQTIRILRNFTSRDIQTQGDMAYHEALRYLREFVVMGVIEVVKNKGGGRPAQYRLVKDVGPKAPMKLDLKKPRGHMAKENFA